MGTDKIIQEKMLFHSVKDYYSTPESLKWYTALAKNTGLYEQELEMITRFTSPLAKVLDVGCGAGREALELTKMGYTVTGLDISVELLDIARTLAKKLRLKVDFRLVDGMNLDFEDRSFDYILFITQMIHHIPMRSNRINLLKQAGRIVRPDGKILITYHDWNIEKNHKPWQAGLSPDPKEYEIAQSYNILENGDSFTNKFHGASSQFYTYIHHFTKESIESEVIEAGLTIINRVDFRTIVEGKPDESWKPTKALILKCS